MSVALCQFMTLKNASGTVLQRGQNYWISETVSGHSFNAFNVSALISRVSAGAESLAIELAATKANIELVEEGLRDYYVAVINQYQFLPPASGTGSGAARTLVASFTGEFQSAVFTESKITLTVGSNLDSSESQVPPRMFTSDLAGTPPKL